MTALTTTPSINSVAMTPAPAQSALLQSDTFNQMWRVAQAMARSALCPQHLRGKEPDQTAANCLRVVNQAYRWGFDPFAVADESYVVRGKLAYQGKLVAAVINARAGLKERLSYRHEGTGDGRTVYVSGTFIGEDKPKEIDLDVKRAKTDNDMWRKDPDQKLCYSGAIKWARRYCPELILGVLTDDDLDSMAAPESALQSKPVVTSLDQLASQIESKSALEAGETMAADGEIIDAFDEEIPEHDHQADDDGPSEADLRRDGLFQE